MTLLFPSHHKHALTHPLFMVRRDVYGDGVRQVELSRGVCCGMLQKAPKQNLDMISALLGREV